MQSEAAGAVTPSGSFFTLKTNIMKKIFFLLIIWLGALSAAIQNPYPDLTNPDDLLKLGKGRIIEKDNCIIKDVVLNAVKDSWIVYIKNESLHDKTTESIKRLEFPASAWGSVKIEFVNDKPLISITSCYK